MHRTNRRQFIQHAVAAGAAVALPPTLWPAEPRHANDIVELGSTKIKVSRMAVGSGTFGGGRSSNQMRKLGADGVADLWRDAHDNGVFLWDTADGYGSHAAIKIALKNVPREKVVILTKTASRTADAMKADLDRFRQEMGTDYIDIVLLHSRMSPKWDELDKGPMDVLAEAKDRKLVRAVGISCHSTEAMKVAAKTAWLDVCLARINQFGVRMDDDTDQVLPLVAEMRKAGKGVIAMKVLGEGQLRNRLDDALRYAATKDAAHCFTIGCESRAEFKDNFDRIARVSQPA
jgi:aryl-alcohol dehydrogenase-like predicted oxidoreductase